MQAVLARTATREEPNSVPGSGSSTGVFKAAHIGGYGVAEPRAVQVTLGSR